MKDYISIKEREKYQKVWTTFPSYRECSPGEVFAPHFFHSLEAQFLTGGHIIDFGCGTGRVAREFLERGLTSTLVDICSVDCLDPDIQLLLKL